MNHFFKQIKQRHLFQAATVYAVTAWPAIQIADLVVPVLQLPDSVMTLLLGAFIAGFPIALLFAWLFNISSRGIHLATRDTLSEAEQQKTASRMNIAISGSVLLVVSGIIMYQVIFGQLLNLDDPGRTLPPPPVESAVNNDVDSRSIAVLPFVPFSREIDDQYFADGMVEELLNVLSRIDGLRVAARTSSFSYKGVTDKSIVAIGKELGVATILEGSVRKNDVTNTVRVTAQLIDVETGEHIWSETFDREYLDIFRIQDEIATSVGSKLKGTLLGKEDIAGIGAETRNVDAMIAYGKGVAELAHRTASSLNKAVTFFQQAIALDPEYARAFVGIADAKLLLALYSDLPKAQAETEAAEAIDQALRLNDQLAAAHASRGLMLSHRQPKAAEKALLHAISLNPNYAMAYLWYASLLKQRGEYQKAQEYFEKAYQLDPKSPTAAFNVAWGHYQLGSEAKAMTVFSNIIAIDPYYPGAYSLVGFIVAERGQLDEAIDMHQRALAIDPKNKSAITGLLLANIDLGDVAAVDYWFNYIATREVPMDQGALLMFKSIQQIAQGNGEQARQYLLRAAESAEDAKEKHHLLGRLAYLDHDYSQAVIAYERVRAANEQMDISFVRDGKRLPAFHLAYSYQSLGHKQAAQQLIEELTVDIKRQSESLKHRWIHYYDMARLMALKGRIDESLDYLQGAIDTGWTRTWEVAVEPIFDRLRTHPMYPPMAGGVRARLGNMRNRQSIEAYSHRGAIVERQQ